MIFIDFDSYLLAEEHWSHTNLGIRQPTYDSVCKDNSWIHGKCRQRFLSNVYKSFFLFSPRFLRFFNVFLIFISTFITPMVRILLVLVAVRRQRHGAVDWFVVGVGCIDLHLQCVQLCRPRQLVAATRCPLWVHACCCFLVVVVVVLVTSSSCRCLFGGRGTDAPKRWGIPADCHCAGTHLWCYWSRQSTVGVLLPIVDRREVNVQPFTSRCHNVDTLETWSGQWMLGRKPWNLICSASVGGSFFELVLWRKTRRFFPGASWP